MNAPSVTLINYAKKCAEGNFNNTSGLIGRTIHGLYLCLTGSRQDTNHGLTKLARYAAEAYLNGTLGVTTISPVMTLKNNSVQNRCGRY